MLCGSASARRSRPGGRHQVVGWRTHPGEVLGVPPPIGQRPEGPDLEARRRPRRPGSADDEGTTAIVGASRSAAPTRGSGSVAGRPARRRRATQHGEGECGCRRTAPPTAASTSGTSRGLRAARRRQPRGGGDAAGPGRRGRARIRAASSRRSARAQYDAGRYEDAMRRPSPALIARNPTDDYAQFGLGLAAEQGRASCSWPPSTWPSPSRCAPTSATTPARCAASGPGARGSRRDRPHAAPRWPAAPRRRARSTTSRCSTSTASSTSAPTPCPACRRRWPRPARPGMRLGFVTNNAARTPEEVAAHLTDLGVPAAADDVITSSQAAATVVAELLGRRRARARRRGPRRRRRAHRRRARRRRPRRGRAGRRRPGLRPRGRAGRSSPRPSSPSATAPGTSPPTLDATIPSPRGPLPGNGAMVGVVSRDHRPGAARHRQARPGDARRVRPPHRRPASARRRRPARHRHRGRPAGRRGQPARPHRRHRSRARCWPRGPTTGPTCSPPTPAGCSSPHPAVVADGPAGAAAAGRPAGRGRRRRWSSRRGRPADDGRRRPRRAARPVRRALGAGTPTTGAARTGRRRAATAPPPRSTAGAWRRTATAA